MNSSGIDGHKPGYHLHKNETLFLCILPITKLMMVMYNENNKEPKTEPLGTPNRGLQRSERVEPIFKDSAQTGRK